MDIEDQEYQDCVVAWFTEHKFCECSFKGKDHWYEILDVNEWKWDKFDYRIPCYDKSKSQGNIMNDTQEFMNGFNKF